MKSHGSPTGLGVTVNCCQCEGIETRFYREYVEKKLREYREQGPKETTRLLLKALLPLITAETTLLDIGGGVGDIQHVLLAAGVRESFNCEASSGYLVAAEREAARLGLEERVTHIHGNFVEISSRVPEADIVTLDRVICCYHDMPDLVRKSLSKARKLYGIVIPVDRWWVKIATQLYYNLRFLLQRSPFRVFVHPIAEIERLIRQAGFHRIFQQNQGGWMVALYAKGGGVRAAS